MIPYMHLYLKAFDKELQVWISARSPITNTVAFLTFEIIAHPSFLLTLLYYQHIVISNALQKSKWLFLRKKPNAFLHLTVYLKNCLQLGATSCTAPDFAAVCWERKKNTYYAISINTIFILLKFYITMLFNKSNKSIFILFKYSLNKKLTSKNSF